MDEAIPEIFGEVQANLTVLAPGWGAERGNPTIFVALPRQFCHDSATIHYN